MSEILSESQSEENYDFEFKDSSHTYEEAFGVMLESLREIVEFSGQEDVQVAVETQGSLTKSKDIIMQEPKEYERLFLEIPNGLKINFNLAHSYLSSIVHGFPLQEFIVRFKDKIAAVEVSHNNGREDEHLPLIEDSYVFEYLSLLKDKKIILEFRHCAIAELKKSISMIRHHGSGWGSG